MKTPPKSNNARPAKGGGSKSPNTSAPKKGEKSFSSRGSAPAGKAGARGKGRPESKFAGPKRSFNPNFAEAPDKVKVIPHRASKPQPAEEDLVYYILNKPYMTQCQFKKERLEDKTLTDILGYDFPKDVYPVGRLDKDSEGLLILSNDKVMTDQLLNPEFGHERTYWVQVENIPTKDALAQLREGVSIKHNGEPYDTKPCKVRLFTYTPEIVKPRNPAVRFRANIPTAWLEITLTEGKNRQVRQMTAAIGYPTLRLIRCSIGKLSLEKLNLGDGQFRKINKEDIL